MEKKVRRIDWKIIITAIICLTVLECFAMVNHIDGALFMVIAVIIAGLAGYEIKDKLVK